MNESDSNEAFKLFSANRSQGGFTMMNWDPRDQRHGKITSRMAHALIL